MKAHSAKHWTRSNWQHSTCIDATCKKRVNLNMGKVHLFNTKEEADEYIQARMREEFLRVIELKLVKKIIRKHKFPDEWSEELFDAYMIEVGYANRELFNDIYSIPNSDHQLRFLRLYLTFKHNSSPTKQKIEWVKNQVECSILKGQEYTRMMALLKRWCGY